MFNIYLIGYRATGKSTVSNLLAEKLNKKVVHMDDELIKRIGRIDIFVRNNGWNAFRDEETKLLKEISEQKGLIVDCGGGIIIREENVQIIKSTGKCILLKADIATITTRLNKDKGKKEQRPSLTGKSITKEIKNVLDERKHLYDKAADLIIETHNKNISEISTKIIGVVT